MFILLALQIAAMPPAVIDTVTLMAGTKVAVDAGHGGEDFGRQAQVLESGSKRYMVEKIYTCEIAAIVLIMLRERGVQTELTTKGGACTGAARGGTLYSVKKPPATEVFSRNGAVVRRDSVGLEQRVLFAKEFFAKSPTRDSIFVSIHYDYSTQGRMGGYVMVPDKEPVPRLAQILVEELRRDSLVMEFNHPDGPIIKNGTRMFANKFILRHEPTPEMVLVELANSYRKAGRKQISDPVMRQRWADIIVRSIIRLVLERRGVT